jgi:SPP1 gp7 family putative phage head morphogenesis protein
MKRREKALADPTASLDDGAELLRIMQKYWPQTLMLAWNDANDVLGVDLVFTLENEQVQEVLGDLAKKIVNVAETTKDEIRSLVGQAAANGWSTDELAQRIAEHGEIASVNRATLISRTETASAYERGSHLAYVQSGVVSGTEWLLGPDPCPVCQDLGGKVVPLGDEFAPGVKHAPAHPACRCATAPVLS